MDCPAIGRRLNLEVLMFNPSEKAFHGLGRRPGTFMATRLFLRGFCQAARLPVISLFAGCGALELAMSKLESQSTSWSAGCLAV